MKKVLIRSLSILLILGAALGVSGYVSRSDIVLAILPTFVKFKVPVGPNQEVNWQQGPSAAAEKATDRPPNIVVILADDLGFNDVSYYADDKSTATMTTPNIDILANQGVAFTNGYSGTATCAISRAMMMTGRYSTRFGFEFTPTPPGMMSILSMLNDEGTSLRKAVFSQENIDAYPGYEASGMPTDEITIAEVLKTKGYHNIHIGKWHLGLNEGSVPEDQGFDESLRLDGGLFLPKDSPDVVNSYQDYDPIDKFLWAAVPYATSFNTKAKKSGAFEPKGYLTDYYTDEAVKAIEANKNRPFFLYLAHWGIHTPLQATKADYDALSHIKDHRKRVYAAMIRSIDRSVEKVTQALKDNGLEANTIVIFTSDNGGAGYVGLPDINKPYRGWKISLFEGGTHVPYFVKWPKQIPAGTVNDMPISHMDVFGTAAAAAGAEIPQDRKLDGVDLLPYIKGEAEGQPHDQIVWRSGQYQALRTKDWKLQVEGMRDKTWLYHLANDPTEQNNIAESNPEKVAELKQLLAAHNAEQKPSMWKPQVQSPISIDKTRAEKESPDDEYIWWDN